ncbi:MAG: hypothetical protein IRY91_06905 [Gemmatimonadaceae bacterium]|nr:hypothetical protein [Gemmatimonadaceae bacterium]
MPPAASLEPAPKSPLAALRARARAWCAGKAWGLRAVVAAILALDAMRVLAAPVERAGLFGGITLAFHEMGHVLFSPFGEWFAVSGGSITQLAIPIVASLLLLQQGDFFGGAVVLQWLAESLARLSVYIADARAQDLPLVSLGGGDDGPIHDWHYLLGRAGLLRWDVSFGRLTHLLGWIVCLASLALCAWLVREMIRQPAPSPSALA